ncbi:hypothetical protein CHS0354_014086 [Potamilus streckersoni]|uniref:Uncharacterized protein n=1 Tax=Potamilus streckersoni TaxID=2493646 RepID=A0AAE0RMB1_9BIVA|nr:hypothetical protein CHS0354_014086 [Potamilus streckersoni]
MGYDPDTVPIVSINGGGDRENIDRRYSFLETLLRRGEHAMAFLDDPLDGDEFKKPIVAQYEQVRGGINSEKVILYDPKRLRVSTTSLEWPSGIELTLPYLDPDQLVMSKVEVLPPMPSPANSQPLKEFMCLTWTSSIQEMMQTQREEWTRSLIQYSQQVALTRRRSVLMTGDLNYPTDQLSAMIHSMNQRAVKSLYEQVAPVLADYGLDQQSQVDYQVKPSKSLLKLKLYNCNSAKQNVRNVNECFVASEELELKNASFFDMESYTSRQITMETRLEHEVLNKGIRGSKADPKTSNDLKTKTRTATKMTACDNPPRPQNVCPIQAELYVPQRPPRHSGG